MSYTAAAAAGVLGGWAFVLIWARLVPASVQRQFWSTMSSVTKGMVVAEESREFVALYRQLGTALFGYLVRNIGGLMLACLPATALTFALDTWLNAHPTSWNPFFPYLNDLEFVFFCAAPVGALGALFLRRRRA